MRTTTDPVHHAVQRDRERFLLACAIFGADPQKAVRALVDLPAKSFLNDTNRKVLLAVQALHSRGAPVGFPELVAELEGIVEWRTLAALETAIDSEALFLPRLRALREAAGLFDDEQELHIPEVAWFGLFSTWREITAPYTEAPLASLWAAFLVVAGLVCGRNIRIENPRPLYPNFYVMNIGVTGDSKKSTVLWICESVIRRLDEAVEFIRGMVSTEGIYERLGAERHPEGAKALGYADELRALLAVAKRRGTQDLLPKLNTLYYCPEEETIDRREKSTRIYRPFFSLITATSLEYVTDLLGGQEIAGGTLNRFLPITGREQSPKPRVANPSEEAWQAIVGPLREVRNRLETAPVKIAWQDPKAAEIWDSFYLAWKEARRGGSRVEADLTARTHEHILKIALVFTALSGERDFTAEIIARAITVGEWLEKSALHLFQDIGQDRITMAQARIMALVKRAGGRMRKRDLQQRLSKEMPAEVFRPALRGLLEADRLKEEDEPLGSGQKAKVVRTTDNT